VVHCQSAKCPHAAFGEKGCGGKDKAQAEADYAAFFY
jgi:hypothetical protein